MLREHIGVSNGDGYCRETDLNIVTDHSHNMGQYPDGFRGPMIVHDPVDPYKGQYDEEVILTVSDW